MTVGNSSVLVVDDEAALADLFAMWLGEDYDVRVAYDGDEALAEFDEDIDLVLLDRQMPTVSGDEVLAEIRKGGHDCPVVMVTGDAPDFDIIEMSCDEYLVKPVDRTDIEAAVERLLRCISYQDLVREQMALSSKVDTLKPHHSASTLGSCEAYRDLLARLEEVNEQLAATVDRAAGTEAVAPFEPS